MKLRLYIAYSPFIVKWKNNVETDLYIIGLSFLLSIQNFIFNKVNKYIYI